MTLAWFQTPQKRWEDSYLHRAGTPSGTEQQNETPLAERKGAREDLQDVPSLLLHWTDQEGIMVAQGGLNKAPGQENHLKSSPKNTLV